MHLLDIYPCKGTYQPGEPITVEARFGNSTGGNGQLALTCVHLDEQLKTSHIPFTKHEGHDTVPFALEQTSLGAGGYGLRAEAFDSHGKALGSMSTAFDVCDSWVNYPRYGFLTDFETDRDTEAALQWLARFHINGLQFYDWQYRHDQLLPPGEKYIDPLGRELSLNTVAQLIASAQEHGIATLAYLAVYAASLSFAGEHEAWRLFDENGEPCTFEDFLGLMNPDLGNPWVDYLLDQGRQTLDSLPFDGLHIDQYGDPKVGYNVSGEAVDLPAAFKAFIQAAKKRFPKANVTFNAVGNWPIDALAASPQDFIYIELWPETPSYQDVHDVIRSGREKSGGKPVVLAQYIPVDQEANIRLSDALVFALGGSRIELGEHGRLLSDPYFPKHEAIPEKFQRTLRRYYDFAVRYADLVGPFAEILDAGDIDLPVGILPILRRNDRWMALHLINFSGLEEARWCEPHPAPRRVQNFELSTSIDPEVHNAWFVTPDKEGLELEAMSLTRRDGRIHLSVPTLDYWTMILIKMD
jgi:dextranase